MGRLRTWAIRHDLLAVSIAALIGAAVAGAAVAIPLASSLSSKDADLNRAQTQLSDTRSQLADLGSQLRSAQGAERAAKRQIIQLTATGKVPDFAGRTRSEAEQLAKPYDWQLHFQTTPSDAPEGTITQQSVSAGTTLDHGQAITLTVAVPPPKQWTTIQTFTGATSLKTDPFQLPSGQVRVAYTFGGHTNDIVDLNPLHGGVLSGDNLVNEIGSISGSTRVYNRAGTYYFDVTGNDWTLEVQQFK
jgi:hypothetical protein